MSGRFGQRLQRAWLVRGLLARSLLPLAWAYAGVVGLRGALYRVGWKRSVRLPVPVIVVGNLIAGGAGKTPTVAMTVELLHRAGHRPGIVSRGHGRRGTGPREVQPDSDVGDVGDEPLLLRRRTGVPVCVGRDRVAAARCLLLSHPELDVIVADDGLQHLRLARTLQVVVFDERGAGNGWLLPAGPLREPLPTRLPPRTLVLYNAPAPSTPLPGSVLQRSLRGVVELTDLLAGRAESTPLGRLQGLPIVAAAGVAHPERFFGMLRDAGLVVRPLPLPDHYDYNDLPWPAETAVVVTTEKDAVKLDPARLGRTRVWVAQLDFAAPAAFQATLLELFKG